jgi:hypothetical protein
MGFLHFMTEGGWGMWFVLALGLTCLAAATGFALEPLPAKRDAVRSFARSTSLAVLSSVSLNLAAVGSKVPTIPELANSPRLVLVVMGGISESLAPAILGWALLCVSWLVVAIGQRRQARMASTS